MWIIYALSASVVWGLDYVLAERFFKARFALVLSGAAVTNCNINSFPSCHAARAPLGNCETR